MFCGPTVGGFLTQHLNFEWAAAVQGSFAFLGVSTRLVSKMIDGKMCCKDIRQKKDPIKKQRISISVRFSGLFPHFVLPYSKPTAAKVQKNWPQNTDIICLRFRFADCHSKWWVLRCLIPVFCLFRRAPRDSEKVDERSPLLSEWGHARSEHKLLLQHHTENQPSDKTVHFF